MSASTAAPALGAAQPGREAFDNRFDALIAEWEARHGRRLHYRELTDALARFGEPASAPYLSLLRRGRRRHPRPELIGALAAFFDVDARWLTTGLVHSTPRSDSDTVGGVRCRTLRRLLRTAEGLSPASMSILAALAEQIRPSDGVPELMRTARFTDTP